MDDRITAERWVRIESLLDAALLLEPAQRGAFLADQTTGDGRLREQVQQLLDSARTCGDLLDRPAADLLEREAPAPGLAAGTRIGAWRVIGLVARGGMGEVYRAERCDGQFQQQVALKLIRRDAIEHMARFEIERRMLAPLDHPGIARLFDSGVAQDERPYMVMEWVEGRPITLWCDEQRAGLAQRLEIFTQVCEAVAYAHRHLLVHRDLKPGNVLVNAEGRAKLLDFGVAKLLAGADLAQHTQAPVTPAYAAPEQLSHAPVTTAADVYALGLLLFEMLSGQRPWHRPRMSLPVLIDKQRREPAPVLSATAAQLAAPPVPARLLRGDLDAIVAKALRKEPEHRYETVAALQADLQRHLRGEPVAARRHARGYVLGRFLRHYRWAVAGVAALVVTLAAGLAGVAWQAQRAQMQARRAEAVQEFISDIFRANTSHQADPVKARQTTARELLDLGAGKIDSALADAPQAKLGALELMAKLYDNLELRDESVRLRRQEVDLARKLYGGDAPELAAALVALAGSMHSSRAVNQQRAVLDEAEAILDRNGDASSDTRALLLRKSAMSYAGTDEARALGYARRSVRLYQGRPPSTELAEAWCMQGYMEIKAGAIAGAISSLTRAIEVSKSLPQRNPNLGRYYAYLSDAQLRAMDIAGAVASARTALDLARALNGEEHVDFLQAQFRLGKLLAGLGFTREGLALLQSAKVLVLKIKGPNDPFHTPDVLAANGNAVAMAGDLHAGLADLDAGIALQRRYHPDTTYLAKMLENRAAALLEAGRYVQAGADLDEAALVRDKARQSRSSGAFNGIVQSRVRLALAQGDVAQARGALAGLHGDEAPSELSFDAIEQQLLTAETELAAGNPQLAAASAAMARHRIEQSASAAYLTAYAARANLVEGLALLQQSRAAEGLALLESALALRQNIYLPQSPKIAEARIALASARLDHRS